MCWFIEGRTPCPLPVSNLRIIVVLILKLDLGVGKCWANILAQVCQPALLSVQSFIPFLARITNCSRWALVYLFILTKTDVFGLGIQEETDQQNLSVGCCSWSCWQALSICGTLALQQWLGWHTWLVSGNRQVITPDCFLSLGLGFGSGFFWSAVLFLGSKAAVPVDPSAGIYN